jgi:hypothetical protein
VDKRKGVTIGVVTLVAEAATQKSNVISPFADEPPETNCPKLL